MKKATYSVFVRFRRKRLTLRRSLSFEDAVRFAEQARRERIHAKDDVLVVEDATGVVIDETPQSMTVRAVQRPPKDHRCVARLARDALGLARVLAVAHADLASRGIRARTRGGDDEELASTLEEITNELAEAVSMILNAPLRSAEQDAAVALAEQALGRLASLRLAVDASELVRLTYEELTSARAAAGVDAAPKSA